MERLTTMNGFKYYAVDFEDDLDKAATMANKLKAYEDAEEEGRLIKFPVAVGDHVWCIPPKGAEVDDITEMTVESLEHNKYGDSVNLETSNSQLPIWFYIEQIGKLVFLSREEAEAKLKEMETDNE